MIETADAIENQQALVNNLINNANEATLEAATAQSNANDLAEAAAVTLNDTNEIIDAIVCTPDEEPCD